MLKLLMAAVWLCMLSPPVSAAAQNRPIEGHQNLRLGMTIAEAIAAEPLARPDNSCPPDTCLSYFDRRFLSTGYQVRADFGTEDRLRSILLSMRVKLGEAPCRRQLRSAAEDFTRTYGAPESDSDGVTTWQDARAAVVLTDGCAAAAGSTIAITIDRRPR